MKRRRFLESSGACLAALGLGGLDLSRAGDRYGRVLAKGTPRKLALLVGINAYPESTLYAPLYGCVTDVRLQRELLIHRFGFQQADILTLTDAQATRTRILEAFEQHLIGQARPGDVVVFHFSGHGSRIADPDRDHSDGLNSTFVPVDSRLPAGFPANGGVVDDITGHSFFLLSRAVASENFTAVLDSCHSGGGTRGNLRIRARPGNARLEGSPGERELQRRWLSHLNLSREDYIRQRRAGVANGVVIASTARDQLAADATFDDVDCGVFTYLLTQYLWQQTRSSPVRSLLPNIARSTTRLSTTRQEPLLEVRPGSHQERNPLYALDQAVPPGDGVLTGVGGGAEVEFWLGGVAPLGLPSLGSGSVYSLVDRSGAVLGEVRLDSRRGLIGRGTVLRSRGRLLPGLLLQEKLRDLPGDVALVIGLDPSLGADRPEAERALGSLPRLRAAPLQQGEVHYILGRFLAASQRRQASAATGEAWPEEGSFGLFTPGGEPMPGAFSGARETVAAAVQRLRPKFKALLAARIFRLALNGDASRLNVTVTMRPEGQASGAVARTYPTRGVGPSAAGAAPTPADSDDPGRLRLGTAVQFEVTNREATAIHLSLLVIDPSGEMAVIFPNNWTADAEATRMEPGSSLLIPDPRSDGFRLVTQEPRGMVEVLVVASRRPIRQALKAFQAIAGQSGQTRGPVTLAEPVTAVEDLLDDLTAAPGPTRGGTSGTRGLAAVGRVVDNSQIATLSLSFEVI
ncbi:caspase family protein [Cyanobium gracile UHCC 0139]|uniref:Caspase family protein n=1 Tax=Cyanobium gracile UHCC 0139 TaxID=3110308 RepID=A0ABU5RRC8_9CYAN|nr:caspase family protein [Cyanobium gracile]MEA5390330.1 caspase family protein [Cyanobium gracile UHCC 0139]